MSADGFVRDPARHPPGVVGTDWRVDDGIVSDRYECLSGPGAPTRHSTIPYVHWRVEDRSAITQQLRALLHAPEPTRCAHTLREYSEPGAYLVVDCQPHADGSVRVRFERVLHQETLPGGPHHTTMEVLDVPWPALPDVMRALAWRRGAEDGQDLAGILLGPRRLARP